MARGRHISTIWLAGRLLAPALVLLLGMSGAARAQSALQISTPAFPLTPVGQSVTQNVTLTVAPGGNVVVFNSIQLAPGVSDYTLGNITGCVIDSTTTYTDGATCTIPVTFTPTLPGNAGAPQPIARAAALQINDAENYLPLSHSIGLIGSATMPRAVIVPGNISDLVGNDGTPTVGFGGDNGPASGAVFNAPTNIAVDSMGNIYIADTANCVVRVVNKATQTISTFAGVAPSPTPNCGPGMDNLSATGSQLNQPTGIAVDAGGNVYIADTGNGAVRMVNPITGIITTVAGQLNTPGYGGDGYLAIYGQLLNPTGLAVDGYGDIFVADTGNYAVREVSPVTGYINTIAGTPTQQGSFSGGTPGGPATSFSLGNPQAVTVDSVGNVYIADSVFHGVFQVARSTQTISEQFIPVGAVAGLAVDASDTLYYAIPSLCSVAKSVVGTALPIPVAGSGYCAPSGDGGSALLAGVNNPNDVVVDGTGSLYILESDGVRFVDSTGTQPTTVAFGPQQILTTSPAGGVLLFNGDVATSAGGTPNPLDVYFSGGIATPFSLAAPAIGVDCSQATTLVPVPLNPAAACELSATFSPQTDGPYNATTSLFQGSPATSTQIINFTGTGTGTGPTATLMPAMQGIAAGIDGGSGNAIFTLTNTASGAPLTISSIAFGNPAITSFTKSTTCGATLAPNGTCTITVTFTPTSAGMVSQTLIVTDNTAAGSQSVTINGTGTAATATLTPSSGALTGIVDEVGGNTVPFTLTNTSTTAGLTVSSIQFSNYNGYNIASTNCYAVVPAGQNCTINVNYLPTSLTATTSSLVVTSDASNSPQTASLTGTSTAPIASLSSPLTFPSTPVGNTTAAQTVTLTNTGSATLHISSIAYAGDYGGDFTVNSSACPTTLAPAATCNITVAFNPAAPGSYSGFIAVTDDSGGQYISQYVTQSVALSGTSPAISGTSSFTIANTAFPSTPVGGVGETQNVTLTLNSTSTVLKSIAIAGGSTEYTIDSITGCTVDGATANPTGTVCTIAITFIPATVGASHNTPLVVTTLESGAAVPYDFALTALSTGTIAALTPGIIGPYVASDGTYGGSSPLSGMGGPATAASVGFFNGIAIDSAHNMYVSDSYYDVIYKITSSGTISIYAGTPFSTGGYIQTLSGDGGPALNAAVAFAGPLALDSANNLYVGDTDSFGNERIRKINATTGNISTVVGGGSGCAAQTDSFGDGCTGTQAILSTGVGGSVTGLAFDNSGNLYFTATSAYTSGNTASIVNYAIRRWNPTTNIVSLAAGAVGQTAGTGADGGNAVGAKITPSTMAFDSNNNLLALDTGIYVRQITPSGTISTIAGAPGSTPYPGSIGSQPCTGGLINSATQHSSGNGGPATAAKFCYLTGIAVDAANNIYLNDYSASEIRRIDSATGTIVEVSGASSIQGVDFGDYNEVLGNNDGSARDASLRYPQDIRLDAAANIYIMEAEGEVRWINVSQSALDFTPSFNPNPPFNREAVNIGTLTGPQQVTVVNAGNSGNVTFNTPFTTPPLFGINTADYTRDTGAADCISTNTGMSPGNECPINIDFTPTVAGTPIQDTDSVSDNAGTQTITMIGYASGAAQLSLLPAIQIFQGNLNTAIGPQTFTLTNNTPSSLGITGITLTGPNSAHFSLTNAETNNCGSSVAANSSCTISVTFQSANAGQFLAQVNVAYSQNIGFGSYPGSLTSNLLGIAGTPEGQFAAYQVAANPGLFGNQSVGTTSSAHSFTFTSTGTIALNISSIAITGTNANQFAITSNTCPAMLQPGVSCVISVTFTPTAVSGSNPYTAAITVTDNAADSPQTAALSGYGYNGTLNISEVIHVTDTPVETPSTLLPITEVIHVTDAAVETLSTLLPITEVIHVTDVPDETLSTLLPISETIHVSDQISGTGFSAVIFLPTTLSFGNVALGASPQLGLQIINSTSSGLSLSSLSLTGSGEFSLHAGTCPQTIAAGNSCVLQAQFSPTATGSASALVSAAGSLSTVPLSGTGVAVLIVTPQSTSRSFGTANPTFIYSVTGFVNGDSSAVVSGAPSLSTTATRKSPAGVYPITATTGTLTAPSYYVFSFASGSLTVNGSAAQTIVFTLPSSISITHPQLTLTAHSTSGLPVSYTATGATISGSTLTLTGTGPVTVTASQSGNATLAPAANVVQSFTVTQ